MSPLSRPISTDVALAERSIAHDVTERRLALREDLVAVGDEEERVDVAGIAEAPVVEAGDDGFAGPGSHDYEVPMPVVNRTLGREFVEDLSLVAPWPNLERCQFNRQISRTAPLDRERLI